MVAGPQLLQWLSWCFFHDGWDWHEWLQCCSPMRLFRSGKTCLAQQSERATNTTNSWPSAIPLSVPLPLAIWNTIECAFATGRIDDAQILCGTEYQNFACARL
eukprot:gnl/MRDRNA2_/MRDRNA2_88504_c0_seq1.p3 gnl/MRDRNA2_/MRDRNA2_88504_c0~~gnl/MRDRNA2_/MRDRNA2_88504_c0_seq1.p3  ORF type:complete len:103 (-),score=10.13 gnl/MRDRNA2_/MRDRNA2_88504_c0_seq1:100-408(-)